MQKLKNIRAAYWRYKGGRRFGWSRRQELLGALWWLSWWNDWTWLRRLIALYVKRAGLPRPVVNGERL